MFDVLGISIVSRNAVNILTIKSSLALKQQVFFPRGILFHFESVYDDKKSLPLKIHHFYFLFNQFITI